MARYERYRALSQRKDPTEPNRGDTPAEGLDHENHNCQPTGAAAGLEHHTHGKVKKRGGDLRHLLPKPDTGSLPGVELNLHDMKVAWAKLGFKLIIAGEEALAKNRITGWKGIKQRRAEGRFLLVIGDSGELDGACSEGQDTGHLIAVHPDDPPAIHSGDWLTMDPWCYRAGTKGLGKWRWLDRDDVWDFSRRLDFEFAYTRPLTKLA